MRMITDIDGRDIPVWLAGFLRSLRLICLRRFYGIPDRMEKAVSFKDIVDMGLVDSETALAQAEKDDG